MIYLQNNILEVTFFKNYIIFLEPHQYSKKKKIVLVVDRDSMISNIYVMSKSIFYVNFNMCFVLDLFYI